MKKMTKEQREAWFKAVYAKDIDTIEKMLEDGFDVNTPDKYGWTALNLACFWKHADMIQLLTNHGADINIQNDSLRTPLHITCRHGHIDIAKLLIENGANINTKDKNGNTPWDELKKRHPQKHEELMQWLAENHPDKTLELMASENIQCKGVGL